MWAAFGSAGRITAMAKSPTQLVVARRSGGRPNEGGAGDKRRSDKGNSFNTKNRRRGRPAWLRSPDDSPLRDGNRDRLLGLLTDRCVEVIVIIKRDHQA